LEDTAEGIKDTAERATDSNTYTGSDDRENREFNEPGGKEPMDPKDIASQESTAVNRGQDTEIAQDGKTGSDSPEAQEKYRKKGMTKV
jgi:hypothetical protein